MLHCLGSQSINQPLKHGQQDLIAFEVSSKGRSSEELLEAQLRFKFKGSIHSLGLRDCTTASDKSFKMDISGVSGLPLLSETAVFEPDNPKEASCENATGWITIPLAPQAMSQLQQHGKLVQFR
ncbi:hypothetical protein Ciccas_011431, partial [Cichlidogyrus casuarinus]